MQEIRRPLEPCPSPPRYLDKDDAMSKHAVAYTFDALNRHNPDRLKAHAAAAMPLAFLAMHEREEEKEKGRGGGQGEFNGFKRSQALPDNWIT